MRRLIRYDYTDYIIMQRYFKCSKCKEIARKSVFDLPQLRGRNVGMQRCMHCKSATVWDYHYPKFVTEIEELES